MDFEKIYADFKAAKAANDLEKMSDIFAQVQKFCDTLAQAGRANEIPPSAFRIARHVYVMLYRVTKLLRGGDVDKAKFYMLVLANNNAANFDTFFFLLYLLGKTFYATGDYSWAAKCFERYEKVRAINFGDVDELALFYRANCLAQLGDFNAAAELYEKILAIKSDFPEAKKNLGAIRGGATKNFSLEVQSLWNFSYWRDVPIFINARDRLGVMKKLIGWLLDAGYRKIFVLDNRSTYPPLLEYYSVLEKDSRIKIIRLKKNFGFKALWLSGILERLKISTPYIYTDPDVIPIERCPKDFVKRLMKLLDENREVRKVGLGLVYEDITFPEKDYIQETEANLYDGTRVGDDFHFVQIDTTLALYSNVRHYSLRLSLRTSGDLRVYHLPWYFDYDNLPADEKYYLEHADKNSVTSVKNFLS
ncbi:MAG: tetratricopeptide repeat protein [Selenomonadaceae bacterium]|nr:tetratricopeptide repeat protein [Selenomonadaceae bacterium]MBQ3726081.1 tetratricopeptide repeat protein [Selenomonadaceae bacterium]